MMDRALWIHGWGTSPAVWTAIRPTTPPHPEVIATDDASRDLVDEVAQTANRQGAEALIGWSLGGMLAIAAAARIPTLRRLILIGARPSFCRNAQASGWPPAIVQKMRQAHRQNAAAVRKRFFAQHLAPHADWLQQFPDSYGDPGLAFLETADLHAAAAAITLPVFVLHGADDSLFPPPCANTASGFFPKAALSHHLLPGCGHAPFLDQPESCRDLIARFLA